MPNEEYDEAMQQGYDAVRMPKPVRQSEHNDEFAQMTRIARQLTELVDLG
jgi:hypothetical protein